ncbi:unnamed protein product [Pleuronectes platessa]|uniref:Uncharacterized protein n=1 Tax=Pleuronectes platessa TaxID=8262 RepID=A0A9N7VJS5_PLEPL|nr:unnamed protein product [Pleuronectes platessa]
MEGGREGGKQRAACWILAARASVNKGNKLSTSSPTGAAHQTLGLIWIGEMQKGAILATRARSQREKSHPPLQFAARDSHDTPAIPTTRQVVGSLGKKSPRASVEVSRSPTLPAGVCPSSVWTGEEMGGSRGEVGNSLVEQLAQEGNKTSMVQRVWIPTTLLIASTRRGLERQLQSLNGRGCCSPLRTPSSNVVE